MTIKTTSAATFQADVVDSTGLVLVLYYISGLPGVDSALGVMTLLDETYGDSVTICKIECSTEEQLMTDNLVNVIPMVVGYKDGVKFNEFRHPPRLEVFSRLVKGDV